tara:strand:- start:938 stop:1270 length:333 start_codon:yes stop_codon:yes gene_type:complete
MPTRRIFAGVTITARFSGSTRRDPADLGAAHSPATSEHVFPPSMDARAPSIDAKSAARRMSHDARARPRRRRETRATRTTASRETRAGDESTIVVDRRARGAFERRAARV